MRFEAKFPRENFLLLMRRAGYAADGEDEKTGEWRFSRYLGYGRSRYPRFHLYCKVDQQERKASCNLHLDQKQPSYQGVSAHSGEYDGELVEQEAKRIAGLLE